MASTDPPLAPSRPGRPAIDTSPPTSSTSPNTAVSPLASTAGSTHRKRGSIASPIQPILHSSSHRRLLSQSTPQHTPLAPHAPAHLTPRHVLRRSAVSADPYNYPQLFIGGILASIVLSGITLSLWFDTSIDTSVASLLPARSAYLARKENLLNQWFVKKSWGWTSAAYLLHWISSPPGRSSRRRRLLAFGLATAAWVLFSVWAFGPSLNLRLISLSGGTCAVALPQDQVRIGQVMHLALPDTMKPQRWGGWVMVPVPPRFCLYEQRLTEKNHPALFGTLRQIFGAGGAIAAGQGTQKLLEKMIGRARFHAGFDISGHVFLLTLASLVLAREIAPSWRGYFGQTEVGQRRQRRESASAGTRGTRRNSARRGSTAEAKAPSSATAATALAPTTTPTPVGRGGTINYFATIFASALIGLWTFMLGVTAIWFHNPPEKLAGLGLKFVGRWASRWLPEEDGSTKCACTRRSHTGSMRECGGVRDRTALTPALGLTTSALIALLTPSMSSAAASSSPSPSPLDDYTTGSLHRGWKVPSASDSAMLEDVFVGEDENAARRGADGDGVDGAGVGAIADGAGGPRGGAVDEGERKMQ